MPGFISRYVEVTTVQLGEQDGVEYWVKIRPSLSRGDYRAVQDRLMSPVMRITPKEEVGPDGKSVETEGQRTETTTSVDSSAYQNELVARSLVDWNLTDENGNIKPIGIVDPIRGPDRVRYDAVDWLPQDVFDKLMEIVNPRKVKVQASSEDEPFPQGGKVSALPRRAAGR